MYSLLAKDVLVIDTREPDEASMSPIPSAVNVPFSRVPEVFKEDFHPGQFQQVSMCIESVRCGQNLKQ